MSAEPNRHRGAHRLLRAVRALHETQQRMSAEYSRSMQASWLEFETDLIVSQARNRILVEQLFKRISEPSRTVRSVRVLRRGDQLWERKS